MSIFVLCGEDIIILLGRVDGQNTFAGQGKQVSTAADTDFFKTVAG